MRTFDRFKFIALLFGIWILHVWSALVNNPLQSLNDVGYVVTNSGSGRVVVTLIIVDSVRQIHYLLAEWNAGYFGFWNEFFSITERLTHRFSQWTQFLFKRTLIWSISIFIAASWFGDANGLSAFESVILGVQLAFDTVPVAIQLIAVLIFVVVSFDLIFWYLWRGKIEVIIGGKNVPVLVRISDGALSGSDAFDALKINLLLRRLKKFSLRYESVNVVFRDSTHQLCSGRKLLSNSALRILSESDYSLSRSVSKRSSEYARSVLLAAISKIDNDSGVVIPRLRHAFGLSPRKPISHRVQIVSQGFDEIIKNRHALAIHEACHVVVSLRLRPDAYKGQNQDWISDLDDDVAILLAAIAGEQFFYDKDQTYSSIADLNDAKALIAFVSTASNLQQVSDKVAFSDSRFKDLLDRSTKLVSQNRKEILSVAHALETNKTLSNQDFIAILDGEPGVVVDGAAYKT
ncbi:MAG: hypothetical protein RLZZ426_759, partial [Actinomycetota bacterium]